MSAAEPPDSTAGHPSRPIPPPHGPPQGYPPQGYPPPGDARGYPPQSYPPPGYPPPGYPPQGPVTPPRQHAWRSPYGSQVPSGGGRRPARQPSHQRSLVWLIVVVALVVILLRAHRITSTEVIIFCVLIPSVILHEIAHGVVALAFGDDTAKRAGRLTLNPLPHVTVWGTIIVPAITVIAGWGFFGWAKPVPVDVRKLRSPRNHGLLVSLAGPLTNIVLSAVLGLVFYLVFVMGHPYVQTTLPMRIVLYAGVINLWVAVFNMIPVPPLDGSALVERLLPARWWPGYLRLRPYGLLVILGVFMLLSFANVYPLATVFEHLTTWWLHLVRAA